MGATVWKPFFQRPLVHDYWEKISTFVNCSPKQNKTYYQSITFLRISSGRAGQIHPKSILPYGRKLQRRYTSSEFNMEPKNEGLVQMFFPFKWVIFRFKNASFPGCNSQSPWKVAFFSEMILSLLGLCFDLFSGANLLLVSGRAFSPLINEHDNGISSGSTPREFRIPVANEDLDWDARS